MPMVLIRPSIAQLIELLNSDDVVYLPEFRPPVVRPPVPLRTAAPPRLVASSRHFFVWLHQSFLSS